MAFSSLGYSNVIARNSPKHKRLVEPFGDSGTMAFELTKKRPKEHILNIVDEALFSILKFLQNIKGREKQQLKKLDWIGSQETFDKVVKITSTEGLDFFYKFFYLKYFTLRTLDKEVAPTFDIMRNKRDASNLLRAIPIQKIGLKKVIIINEDSVSIISKYSGPDTFIILNPRTPEEKEQVKTKLKGLSSKFFYTEKSMNSQILIDDVAAFKDLEVSIFASSSIMMSTMEVITNYETKLEKVESIIGEEYGE